MVVVVLAAVPKLLWVMPDLSTDQVFSPDVELSRGWTIYFIVVGVGASVAILFPFSILLGFFLGILPGLFLLVCPTLVVYTPLWLLTRQLLKRSFEAAGMASDRRSARYALGFAALALVVAAASVVPMALNRVDARASAALRADDREPTAPIALPDDVALVWTAEFGGNRAGWCETICLRLLFNGATKRVLIERRPHWTFDPGPAGWFSYRIERLDRCPQPMISETASGANYVVFPADHNEAGAGHPIVNRVRARIAAGECLIVERVEGDPHVTTLSIRAASEPGGLDGRSERLIGASVKAQRLEITDPEGRTLFRRTEVETEPLAVPLIFGAWLRLPPYPSGSGLSRNLHLDSPIGVEARDILPTWLGRQAMQMPKAPPKKPKIDSPR